MNWQVLPVDTDSQADEGRTTSMKRKLAKGALFSTKLYNEHRLRARRRLDGQFHPEGVTDVESPETSWERVTPERIQKIDPNGGRALALLRQFGGGA